MKSYRPEIKPTGKPEGRLKLTTRQRQRLEREEAEAAIALQRKLKQEFLERDAAKRPREAMV
jgi:hypothetical protein